MDTILIEQSRLISFLGKFFVGWSNKSHKKYVEAVKCLDRAEYCINNIGVEFPDHDSYEFPLIKNVWTEATDKNSRGVRKMAIHIGSDYWSVITHVEQGGYVNPHTHSNQFEVIKIIEGKMKEKITGKMFERGDIFVIPKGKAHHLVSVGGECYLYMLYTEDEKNLVLPHQETDLLDEKIFAHSLVESNGL